jgi:hypothetical protein
MTVLDLLVLVAELRRRQAEIEEMRRRDGAVYDPLLKRWVGFPGPHNN